MPKRKSGPRSKSGRLKNRVVPYDRGADYIEMRAARFHRFQGGKAGPHLESLIGRAWAVGLLENDRVDPAELRDAGTAYAALYWSNFGSVAGVANYEGDCRRGSPLGEDNRDPSGEAFKRADAILDSAGREAAKAVHQLAVDPVALMEAGWITRLIEARLSRKPEDDRDRAQLRHALRGLLTLVEGSAIRIARAA